jgi:3-isopropylmalate/(R)-2-methylmalate dehydratase large subunit
MGKTISEKIIARASNTDDVSAGDIVWVDVDKAMMDDILGPRVEIAERMKDIKDEVWDKDKVVIISDHYTPPANIKQAEIVKYTRDWANSHNIDSYYEFIGPCHQIMAENAHVLPGTIVLGTDSHTCMGGALGAFATGVGSTEMLGVLLTGRTWLRVPETISVEWNNNLKDGVMAKDISLATIKEIGHSGATYKAIEYKGEAIKNLSMDGRMCISNMAIEMGAKVGLMEVDEKTLDFIKSTGNKNGFTGYKSDKDAYYSQKLKFDAATLNPLVACPHEVDNVKEIKDVNETIIHQAYLGSCTGGRFEDLESAARIIKGKKIARNLRFLVSPASQEVWIKASKEGILDILAEAGATILAPTCGVCVGLHSGILAAGENCISATNRNFIGRMGSRESNVYLASPMSVAAAAITGRITDPRELL